MSQPTFLNFDLQVQPDADQPGNYLARVVGSPAGEARRSFALPIALPQAEGQRPSALGAALFAALFGEEILGAWRASLAAATAQGQGLRLRLRLNDAPALAILPWEFLYDPSQDSYLALSARTPVVRYLELSRAVEALAVEPPLGILAVIPSPTAVPGLDGEREWENLKQSVAELTAAGKVRLDRLGTASLAALQGRLRRQPYHILHYIGHGAFDPESGAGLLIWEDEAGQASVVRTDRLGALLADHGSLRLVVLNSCEGGRTGPGDAFAGAAPGLVRQGIPGVIAMQSSISDSAAVAFSRELYAALADLYPVDAAVAEARKAIYSQGNDREWATPVLYLRSGDACLFRSPSSAENPSAQPPIQAPAQPPAQPAAGSTGVTVTISGSAISSGQSINIGNIGGTSQPPGSGGD